MSTSDDKTSAPGGDDGRGPERPATISIVTPNYNGAEFLERTIRSVVDQDCPSLEFVVVDGASVDGSMSIINRYRPSIARIICEPDDGHADALNKGFAATTGEIMGWINSDDILLPGALQFIERLFRNRPDVDWITGRPSSMNEADEIGWVGPLRPWSRLRFLSGDNKWIQQESTFWRRSLWDRAGGKLDLRYSVANDFDLWRRFFRHAELHSVDRHLGCFRIRSGQRSVKFKDLYDTEMNSILKEEHIVLEPEFRAAFEGLLPESEQSLKSVAAIAADRRYAIGDPPIISAGEALGWGDRRPRRAASMPIGQAFAGDDLSRFKGLHAGSRCFIMGNGPSLNETDLTRLEGEIVFACNAAFLLFDRIKWRPAYYACVDSRVLPDRAAEIAEMLDENPAMQGFFPAFLQEHTGSKFRRATRIYLKPGRNRHFFNEKPNSTDDLPNSMFSRDVNDYVVQPYTVAITMMQIAAYMGFTEIVLVGCDTNYVVPATVKRGDEGPDSGFALTSAKDDDPNHFDPRYFGKDRKWHDPQPEMMMRHYEHAKTALDAIGVKVTNATVGGMLEVFPRVRFDDVTKAPAPAAAAPVNRQSRTLHARRRVKSVKRKIESVLALVWRARALIAVCCLAAAAIWILTLTPVLSSARPTAFAAAAFAFLLVLIAVVAVRLRGFIVELSRQVLDIANGAVKPDHDALISRLELESEVSRLREEIEAIRAEVTKSRRNG